jgi:hypothetical protein
VFRQYAHNAPRWCKRLLLNAIDRLLAEPLLRHDGPSSVFATVLEQPAEARRIVHLLHAIPERRGADFDVIEDVIPLYGLTVSLRADAPVGRVALVPDDTPLPFHVVDGRIIVTVPCVRGHQALTFEA